MLLKAFLLFYGSIFHGGSKSNSLQYFSTKNKQWDIKKNVFPWSNKLAEHEKGKKMNQFWNFIQNSLKQNINLNNNNRRLRQRTRQVVT